MGSGRDAPTAGMFLRQPEHGGFLATGADAANNALVGIE